MNLLEHEAKELLKRSDLRVPEGRVFDDRASLMRDLKDWSFPLMVKGQVPTGGRGKAGAVRKANDVAEAIAAFDSIMGMRVKGHVIRSILVERFARFDNEYYLAIAVDRAMGCPLLIVGRKGGVDIESSANQDVKKMPLDPFTGIGDEDLTTSVEFLDVDGGAKSEIVDALKNIWSTFTKFDCELVEVNPLIMTDAGPVCLDAKMIINDDSLYRHPDLHFDADRGREPFEIACRRNGFSGVDLGGEIAVIANGAGLTMAVLDEMGGSGLRGGAFLDLGGADDPDRISKAIALVLDSSLLPNIEGLFICVFGGITRCDIVAEGIIAALRGVAFRVPIVIRLRGINESEGRMMLEDAGHAVHDDIAEACIALKAVVRPRA
jgi:succinyl-CoA synthetase beta subunit